MGNLKGDTSQVLGTPAEPVDTITEDRRTSERVKTVYRVARVRAGTDEGLARVHNISDKGVMLQLHIPVLLGDSVAVELSDGLTIWGQVVWTSGADCGLQFSEALDSAALLTALAVEARSGYSRALRLPVITSALTRSENGLRVVEVRDVSQRGMKFKHDGSFVEGLQVKITLQSGKDRRGVVRWVRDDLAGLILLEPFSPEELGSVSRL